MKPQFFSSKEIEYLQHQCTKAAYQVTGDGQLTRAFPLSEDGREVVAAAVAKRFAQLVRELGADREATQ